MIRRSIISDCFIKPTNNDKVIIRIQYKEKRTLSKYHCLWG